MERNRRGGVRQARISIPAEVLVSGRRRSFAWVSAVSRTGARLRCAMRLTVETPIDLILHSPGYPPLGVHAVIARVEVNTDAQSFDVSVRFVDTPAPQLDTLALIVRSLSSGTAPAIDQAVVIVANDSDARHQLAKLTAAVGMRPVLVNNPLDAILWLQDPRTEVVAIIASDRNPDLSELLAYLCEVHPTVRRVISVERAGRRVRREQAVRAHVDAVISLPAHPQTLRNALLPQ